MVVQLLNVVIVAPGEPLLEAGSDKLRLLLAILLPQLLDQCLAIFLLLETLGFLPIENCILADLIVAIHAFPAEDGIVVRITFQLTDFFEDFLLRFLNFHEEATPSPFRHFL